MVTFKTTTKRKLKVCWQIIRRKIINRRKDKEECQIKSKET